MTLDYLVPLNTTLLRLLDSIYLLNDGCWIVFIKYSECGVHS